MGREIRYGLSTLIQDGSITEAKLADGSITNAKVNASAAIDVSKLANVKPMSLTLTPTTAIAAYDFVRYGDGSTTVRKTNKSGATNQGLGYNANVQAKAQSVLGADVNGNVNAVLLKLTKFGNPTDNLTIEIRSGSQVGTLLASSTIAGTSAPATPTEVIFTMNATVTMTAGTTYFIVMTRSGGWSASDYYQIVSNGANPYANGTLSERDATTWTDQAGWDAYFELQDVDLATNVLKSSAINATRANKVVGIATAAISAGVAGEVQTSGLITNVAWNWTPSAILYLSDTEGLISQTAGTSSKTIGKAISATQIVVNL